MGKKSGSGIRDEQTGSYFLELVSWVKILKFFDGSGIRYGNNSDLGSEMGKGRIRHPG
jgi:hypothetical protein